MDVKFGGFLKKISANMNNFRLNCKLFESELNNIKKLVSYHP